MPEGAEGVVRVTMMADPHRWAALPDQAAYQQAKVRAAEQMLGLADRWWPGVAEHVVFQDVFTPRTIERYTGHVHGSVYGSPQRIPDGRTPVDGLLLCGTDQGFVGVVGAMNAGVMVANDGVLAPQLETGG